MGWTAPTTDIANVPYCGCCNNATNVALWLSAVLTRADI